MLILTVSFDDSWELHICSQSLYTTGRFFVCGSYRCQSPSQVSCTVRDEHTYKHVYSYLETGGHDATVRPWLWILWLFLGPVVGSITFQWYIFVAVSTNIRIGTMCTYHV